MKNKLYWKIQFAKRLKVVDSIDDKKNLVLEYKVVDGIPYVLKEYEVFKSLEDYQAALFERLRKPMGDFIFNPSLFRRFWKLLGQ